ncbi:hypothetical protein [Nocardia sp. NPDC024068]|uniref:hypothetical protein n=1 Tax=Nocardia sp. NPDC024068 TaxID=3157197 RepID=UPI003402C40F
MPTACARDWIGTASARHCGDGAGGGGDACATAAPPSNKPVANATVANERLMNPYLSHSDKARLMLFGRADSEL